MDYLEQFLRVIINSRISKLQQNYKKFIHITKLAKPIATQNCLN